MSNLTLLQLEKQQAESEGYQQGPEPELNIPNTSAQSLLGNTVTPVPTPVPYYPGATETPNLEMSLTNMGANLAENFVLIDSLFPVGAPILSIPVISQRMQYLNTTAPESISLTSSVTQLYAVSLYMSSPGTGAAGHLVVCTISYISEIGPQTITVDMPMDSNNVVMETYPLMALGGTTITLSTAYAGGATNDAYNISARIVQMP